MSAMMTMIKSVFTGHLPFPGRPFQSTDNDTKHFLIDGAAICSLRSHRELFIGSYAPGLRMQGWRGKAGKMGPKDSLNV